VVDTWRYYKMYLYDKYHLSFYKMYLYDKYHLSWRKGGIYHISTFYRRKGDIYHISTFYRRKGGIYHISTFYRRKGGIYHISTFYSISMCLPPFCSSFNLVRQCGSISCFPFYYPGNTLHNHTYSFLRSQTISFLLIIFFFKWK
jgi:hypothetical protein